MGQNVVAHADSKLAPGYRLDRYELLGPLAEGGMASVWIARQRGKHGFEKLVALKTILPKFAADERFQQMFLDEARIASRIEHFNVAQILDLGEEHDVLYLAMEYVDGDSLAKLRRACQKKNVPMPPGVVLRILADVCSGLHEAHELTDTDGKPLDIVHRDISPHNVLVSVKGVSKLIDFGIAKARDRLAGETNAGVLKGKVQYMAPEQALGRKVDRRADLWAVGTTLYHCLAGKPPYEAENTIATLHLLTSGRPPLPLPAGIHPAIGAITRKALMNPPEQRFATAQEMRDAMERAMIEAKCPTTVANVAAFVSQHLQERATRRHELISLAIAAAEERQRVEALLQAPSDRTGSGVVSVTGHTPDLGPPPSGPLARTKPGVAPPANEPKTVLLGPAVAPIPISGPGPLGAPMPASAPALDEPPPFVPRRRTPLLVAGGVALLVVVAVVVAIATRPTPHGHPMAATQATASSAPSAAPTIPAPPASTGPSLVIPVVAASALPEATHPEATPTGTAAPHHVWTAPHGNAGHTHGSKGTTTIDDGF